MTATELLSPEALAALRAERPTVARPAVVRYPFDRWAVEPYRVQLAEQGVDFWVTPGAFADALSMYARRNGLAVQRAAFVRNGRPAVLFTFSERID